VDSASPPAPPGWYPDPGGERQWRVWTGTQWSDTTRPYVTSSTGAATSAPTASLVLRYVRRYGVLATFSGLGLLVGVLAHWPGSAQPVPAWFAFATSNLAVGLLALGSVVYALAARSLNARWNVIALIPGLNVAYVSGLLGERLSGTWPTRRVVAEVVILVLFVSRAHAAPWLAVVPVLVGLSHYGTLRALEERGESRSISLAES
jgi:Protein of unknown function (DUF2510)